MMKYIANHRFPLLPMLLTIAALGTTSCATHKLSLISNPARAEVYARGTNEINGRLLGVTPLALDAIELNKENTSSGPLVIEFKKDGYEPKSVLLTESAVAGMMISAELSPTNGLGDSQQINWSVENLFEAQRLIKIGRYDEALRLLNSVEKVTPQLSVLKELKGTVYYLRNQYQDAMDSYAQVLKINPKNIDALKMVNLLKGLVPNRGEETRQPARDPGQ